MSQYLHFAAPEAFVKKAHDAFSWSLSIFWEPTTTNYKDFTKLVLP